MSSISSYDELNIIPSKRRIEPYEEYFSKMLISDKEKRERIAFSEQMEAGSLVASETLNEPEWLPTEPGSPAESIEKIACSKD